MYSAMFVGLIITATLNLSHLHSPSFSSSIFFSFFVCFFFTYFNVK